MLPTVANQAPAPQGRHYTVKDIADCPMSRRYIWLSRSLRMGDGQFAFILYHYLVQEYRDHQNKKRALFIFDHCLSRAALGAVADVDPHGDGINLSINYSRGELGIKEKANALDAQMAKCQQIRTEYLAVSWWGQLKIGFGDTRPPRALFDDITNAGVDGGDAQLRAEFMMKADDGAQIRSQSHYSDLVQRLPTTRQALIAASFDTDRLGVDQIEICQQ